MIIKNRVLGTLCLVSGLTVSLANGAPQQSPFGTPDYYADANYLISALPEICTGADTLSAGGHCTITSPVGSYAGGIHKFVDKLPNISQNCADTANQNSLGQCIPIAAPDKTTFAARPIQDKLNNTLNLPDSDYYSLEIGNYGEAMHTDLKYDNNGSTLAPTRLQGYRQIASPGSTTPYSQYQYLGPFIFAGKDRPVRIKFKNSKGYPLQLPVDENYWGAGLVDYNGQNLTAHAPKMASMMRSNIHLHGGDTPWISDGTPSQWITPAGDLSGGSGVGYQKGVSFRNAPDAITNGYLLQTGVGVPANSACGATANASAQAECIAESLGDGLGTLYYPNAQTSRFMWFHDHSYGATRLNVYAGEAAGYILSDQATEDGLKLMGVPGTIAVSASGIVNLGTSDLAHLTPIVIQDKTFVPDNGQAGGQVSLLDATWPSPTNATQTTSFTGPVKYWLQSAGAYSNGWGTNQLWFPHVYMTNQLPGALCSDATGQQIPCTTVNDIGRWDYGPWMGVPFQVNVPPVACTTAAYQNAMTCPGTGNPSGVPEAFMDTMTVNGAVYPHLDVLPDSYRWRLLNASDDRMLNLGLYIAQTQDIAVNIVDTLGSTGFGAVADATVSVGSVTNVRLTDPGLGYTATTNSPLTGGSGTLATAYLLTDNVGNVLKAIPVGGTGYQVNDTLTDNLGNTYTVATLGASGSSVKTLTNLSVTHLGTSNPMRVKLTYGLEPTDLTALGLTDASVWAAVNSTGNIIDLFIKNGGANYIAGGQSCENVPSTMVPLCTEVKQIWPQVVTSSGPQSTPKPLCTGANSMMQYASQLGLINIPDLSLGRSGMSPDCYPDSWAMDGLAHGSMVPDPMYPGPPLIQIGNEGGILPEPVIIPSTATNFNYSRKMSTLLGATGAHGLVVTPAGRPEVLVDFHDYAPTTAGNTTVLILYNDFPAPSPLFDQRYDFYTGDPDQTGSGGPPSTLPGFGPSTRNPLQIRISGASTNSPINTGNLSNPSSGLPALWVATQPKILVEEPTYPIGNGYSSTQTMGTYATYQFPNSYSTTIGGVTVIYGGGYSEVPNINFTAPIGGGVKAAGTAVLAPGGVDALNVVNAGSGYTSPPNIGITGGGGAGASYTAVLSPASIATATLSNPGSGYPIGTVINSVLSGSTSLPCVGCATVAFGVDNIAVSPAPNNGLYATTPTLTVSGGVSGGGTPAVARANLAATGSIATVSPTTQRVCNGANNGNGNGTARTAAVTFIGGTGTGASATAAISRTGVITRITALVGGNGYPTNVTARVAGCPNNANLRLAITVKRPIASVTVTTKGTGYTSAPTVTTVGTSAGTPSATLTATISGYISGISQPTIISQIGTTPTLSTLSFVGSNALQPGGALGTATITRVGTSIQSVTQNSPGAGYTRTPLVTVTGGGVGTGASLIPHMTKRPIESVTMTNAGTTYTALPVVTAVPVAATDGYNSADGGASLGATNTPVLLDYKAIIEAFDPIYGKLGVELGDSWPVPTVPPNPASNPLLAAPLPFGYVDPQSEVLIDGGVANWRIDHIGVDSHALHFHLFNVQVINYVDLAGQTYWPDPNQLGWNETVKTEPFTSIFIALRSKNAPTPWVVPNSIRPLDPTTVLGTVNGPQVPVPCVNNPFALQQILGPNCVPFTQVDPQGFAVNITNALVNVGSEYIYHCHLLSHEENDMMRTFSFVVTPTTPPVLTRGVGATLKITDQTYNETNFIIERSTDNGVTWGTLRPFNDTQTGTGSTTGSGVNGSFTVNAPSAANTVYRAASVNIVGCNASVPALSDQALPTGANQPAPVCSDVTTGWPSVNVQSPYSASVP